MTRTIEKSVELAVPVQIAYDQWTQFEEFPRFMEHVERVRQLDERRLVLGARLGNDVQEWTLEICEQIPGKRIAWKTLTGPTNAGVVTFHRLSDERSKVMLQVDYDPEGFLQKACDALGIAGRRLAQDLEGFKQFVERRGTATGAWRGSIPSVDERQSSVERP